MSQLLSIRKNIFYTKKSSKSKELNRVHEMVLILDKPVYRRSDTGIIRERGLKEVRFVIPSDAAFDELITLLTQMKDSKEENLH